MQQQQSAQQTVQKPLWSIYFPSSAYNERDDRFRLCCELISELSTVLESSAGKAAICKSSRYDANTHLLWLNFEILENLVHKSEVRDALQYDPEAALACMAAASHQVLLGSQNVSQKVVLRLISYTGARAQVEVCPNASEYVDKLVTFTGKVIRADAVKPLAVHIHFSCLKCGACVPLPLRERRFKFPTKCTGEGCRSRTFSALLSSFDAIDWQNIRVQEMVGARGLGALPSAIDVELLQDLTASCAVGNIVTVVGFVRTQPNWEGSGAGRPPNRFRAGRGNQGAPPPKQVQQSHRVYIEAVSLTLQQNCGGETKEVLPVQHATRKNSSNIAGGNMEFSKEDLQFIADFTTEYEGCQLPALVHSFCPRIYGLELVKAGILLSLAGGVSKHQQDKNAVPIRGDIHVLLVGDPGLGKSQLLQAATTVAPKGLYVSGNTSTSAGLTVAVHKDPASGEYTFEAGALLLADNGVCCVDEFDKISADHQALLEAMENQEVSVAKAAMVASLPAHATIIAAANPAGGHYDKGKSVMENLKMGSPMLSRFDLIFVMMDKKGNHALTEHVLALHSGVPSRAETVRDRFMLESQKPLGHRHSAEDNNTESTSSEARSASPLLQRLKSFNTARQGPHLTPQQIRIYLAYAKQFVHPRLSDAAKKLLLDFYLHLRKTEMANGSIPITARQLESMIRLSEARARLELREEITEADAMDVIDLMKQTVYKYCDSVTVGKEWHRSNGTRGGQKAELERFLEALQKLASTREEHLVSKSEMHAVAGNIMLMVKKVDNAIDRLNEEGDLVFKGGDMYKVKGAKKCTS